MTIWASRRDKALLRFTRRTWSQLMLELRRRGQGHKESGAFLLGRPLDPHRRVRKSVYLDDLDPECLQGGIKFNGLAYSALWNVCEKCGLTVVGDIHTHPGAFVMQSAIDADNPMIAQRGHVALIVPHLATRTVRALDVGVHLYDGSDGWTSWIGNEAADRISIGKIF